MTTARNFNPMMAVVVLMAHAPKEESKLVAECTLPLTGTHIVNMMVMYLGLFEFEVTGGRRRV